ncbi:MAG TPA: MmoB/DmpM family protein [Solirubrobacteraceae bacterium]|nr:MmoB/DmpM family protein [Solirubrobacteraceae bacterium]
MKVRFEPIGEEIECAPDETVLDAAFRQGLNLVYGCREGQCSACKCFLMEGEVALKRYSNFALSDSEQSSGYSLMCRAMPEQDLVVELLHYDPDSYRLEHAIGDGEAVVEAVEPLTHDITRLVLRAPGFAFTPGQYVDLHVPGADGVKRSFSMANLPGTDQIELMIKRYPGGRLSGMLEGQITVGDTIGYTGPYGSLRAREGERPVLMIAGGSGMAPILSLLREFARQGCARPVRFFYGARTEEDLFHLDEIAALGERLPNFAFTPVTGRFVHEAVDEHLAAGETASPDVYMCGPPPMVEAAEEMLVGTHKLDEQRIYIDKFTTSAEAADADAGAGAGAGPGPAAPVKKINDGAVPRGDDAERTFGWFTPRKRRASLYEDVTIDTQPSVHRHLKRGWPLSFEDGRGTWDDGSTALRCGDWFAFRDPGEQWERPFYQAGAATEQQLEAAFRSAGEEGLLGDFAPEWVEFLRGFLQVPAYVEHGLWFAMATIARDCLSDSVSTVVCLQAAMKQRSAQAIVLYAMDLEENHGPFPIEAARDSFLTDPAWQPTRRFLERLAATPDWGEVIVAANLCLEPIVLTLIRRELGTRAAAANGDTVTPVLARVETQEWEWARAWTTELTRFLLGDPDHGEANREVIGGWVREWLPLALEAALALVPIAEQIPTGIDIEQALEQVRQYASTLLVDAGLPELSTLVGIEPPVEALATVPPVREQSPKVRTRTRRRPPAAPTATTDGAYDFVGIVMAKSAEGDAVAEILGRRDDIEVLEQPAFWDIRARDRLEISYSEVSEALGYEIDAYSIQHEMSTHYGRMVASDDALMLFSDPTEAMQYLMS